MTGRFLIEANFQDAEKLHPPTKVDGFRFSCIKKGINITNVIFKKIAALYPNLKFKLHQAGIGETPSEFIQKTVLSSFYITTGLIILSGAFLLKSMALFKFMLLVWPVLFFFMFFYLLKLPDMKILTKEKEIDKEIVFAGRFLVLELKSGIPLYDALVNVSKNYKMIGKHFSAILQQVNFGTPLEDALNQAIETTPSPNFRKLLWQIVNSLKTGSDIAGSLETVIEQITKEQMIEIMTYGKKLAPLTMFYMVVGVILPTLGMIALVVISSFVSIEISLTVLIILALFIAFIQLIFLAIIKSARPAVEI